MLNLLTMYSKLKFTTFLFFLFLFFTSHAQSKLVEGELEIVSKSEIKYFLYYPEDYQENPNKKYGILLFLHGSGSIPKNKKEKFSPPKLLTDGTKFPFLILVPQLLEEKKLWNTASIMQLLNTVVKNNRVNTNKIYLSGLSRGGVAAWDLAIQYPNTFAALSIVCSMAPTPYAHWINKSLPIWVFHGEEDMVIPISDPIEMVASLKKMNYNVKFTKYKGLGHNIWDVVYNNPELYIWFDKQKKM